MGFFSWIIVGLVAGLLARMVIPGAKDEPSGLFGTLILGIVGAVVGGWIWSIAFNEAGATGINIPSIFVAFVGSSVVIGLLRMFDSRTRLPH